MIDALKIKLIYMIINSISYEIGTRYQKNVEVLIRNILSLQNEEEKTRLIQFVIMNTEIETSLFPIDFDISKYVYSDSLRKRFENKDADYIINKMDENSGDDYKCHLIINNVSFEKQLEIVEQSPIYLIYVCGENQKRLYDQLNKDINLNWASTMAESYKMYYLYDSNRPLLIRMLKDQPRTLTTLKDIHDEEIDNIVLDLAVDNNEYYYYYCGNNPEILKLKKQAVKDNYADYFKTVLSGYGGEYLIYKIDKAFIIDSFREMLANEPDVLFKLNQYTIIPNNDLYGMIRNHDFTYEQLKEWIPREHSCHPEKKDDNYHDMFIKLIKKDVRFFEFLIIDYEDDPEMFKYAESLLKEDFSNIQYITLSAGNSKAGEHRISNLVIPNMRTYKKYMKYMTSYFSYPEVLKELKRLIEIDPSLIQYFELSSNDEYYYDKKTERELKKVEKTIERKLTENPNNCVYYKGDKRKILDLMIENGSVLDAHQIRKYKCTFDEVMSDGSNGQKALVDFILSCNHNLTREQVIDLFSFLLKNNKDIIDTINFEIFNEEYFDIFRINNVFNKSIIKIIFRYDHLQEMIIVAMKKFEDTNLLKRVFAYLMINHPNNLKLLEKTLGSIIENKNLYALATSAIYKYPEKQEEILMNSIYLMTRNIKIIKINNEEDILHLEEKIDNKCEEIINNTENYRLVDVKEALLLEKFGISYHDALILVKKYGSMGRDEPNLTEEETKLITIVESLGLLVTCDSKEELAIVSKQVSKDFDINLSDAFVLEQKLRQMNARHLNQSLTTFDQMKDTHLEEQYGVKIYEALDEENPKDFTMLITSLGAYSSTDIPDDYLEDWLRPTEESHSFCASLISSQLLGIARIKHCVLGFNNIPLDNLLLSAPYDIGSNTEALDVIEAHGNVQFLFPQKMIDTTRHTHNELVIERIDGDKKILPSCVIFTTEHFSPDGKYNGDEKKMWEHALQAAKDFGVPIVVIDRSKIKKFEKTVITNQLIEFKKGADNCHLIIEPLVTRMINNVVGLDNVNGWNKNGFTRADLEALINDIIDTTIIMIQNGKVKQGILSLKELLICLENENDKNIAFNMQPFTNRIRSSLGRFKSSNVEETLSKEITEVLGVDKNGKTIQ